MKVPLTREIKREHSPLKEGHSQPAKIFLYEKFAGFGLFGLDGGGVLG